MPRVLVINDGQLHTQTISQQLYNLYGVSAEETDTLREALILYRT